MTPQLSSNQQTDLITLLKNRFEQNMQRHEGIQWGEVEERLKSNPDKIWSLNEMEKTGGEPDIVGVDESSGDYLIVDCAAESPKGRRSLCYDREALESRKKYPPKNSVMDMAAEMGVSLLTEEEYRHLQQLGEFDMKTSSWVHTPPEIRALGGALFCDRRYNQVFVYHNGADSYYAARGFRAVLRV